MEIFNLYYFFKNLRSRHSLQLYLMEESEIKININFYRYYFYLLKSKVRISKYLIFHAFFILYDIYKLL